MKSAHLVAILFGAVIPVLHVINGLPWHGWFLATTVICTVLFWGCGYVTGYTWFEWKKKKSIDPVTIDKEPVIPTGAVMRICCPYCPDGEGKCDQFLYDPNRELFTQVCDQCGTSYTSVTAKA